MLQLLQGWSIPDAFQRVMQNREYCLNLEQWLEYLEQCHPSNIELGLDRIADVASRLDISFPDSRVITVGGTNGKGSTVTMLSAILENAGYTTACYTSPHLLVYNERVRLGKRLATDEELCASFADVEKARGQIPLTYFEFGTLAALQLFANLKPDFVILEVGLGGRLDAVNIVDPDLAIVTNVDLDHTDWLGDTREAIGFEKAGIFRASRPALIGETNPQDSVIQHALAIGATIMANGQAFSARQVAPDSWTWTGTGLNGEQLEIPDLPVNDFPLDNCSTVLMAINALTPDISLAHIRAGLANTRMTGRFQLVEGRYPTVLDVAHNPHAARRLVQMVRERYPECRPVILLAMLADKNYQEVLQILGQLEPEWFVAGIQDARGLEGKILYNLLLESGQDNVHCFNTIAEAYVAADQFMESIQNGAGNGHVLLVTGSFFTVTAVLELI